jgi:hypothetical protein
MKRAYQSSHSDKPREKRWEHFSYAKTYHATQPATTRPAAFRMLWREHVDHSQQRRRNLCHSINVVNLGTTIL